MRGWKAWGDCMENLPRVAPPLPPCFCTLVAMCVDLLCCAPVLYFKALATLWQKADKPQTSSITRLLPSLLASLSGLGFISKGKKFPQITQAHSLLLQSVNTVYFKKPLTSSKQHSNHQNEHSFSLTEGLMARLPSKLPGGKVPRAFFPQVPVIAPDGLTELLFYHRALIREESTLALTNVPS